MNCTLWYVVLSWRFSYWLQLLYTGKIYERKNFLHIFFCVYMYLTVVWCSGDVIIVCSWWLLAKQFSRSDLLVVCYFWSPVVHPSVYPSVNFSQFSSIDQLGQIYPNSRLRIVKTKYPRPKYTFPKMGSKLNIEVHVFRKIV